MYLRLTKSLVLKFTLLSDFRMSLYIFVIVSIIIIIVIIIIIITKYK